MLAPLFLACSITYSTAFVLPRLTFLPHSFPPAPPSLFIIIPIILLSNADTALRTRGWNTMWHPGYDHIHEVLRLTLPYSLSVRKYMYM